MLRVIDFHSHILPGLDHGCRDVEEALIQLNLARKAGVEEVIATSHYYAHCESVKSFLERREEAYNALRPYLTEEHPQVRLGAEVLLWQGMEKMEHLERLCIEGSNVLLLEMPSSFPWSRQLVDTVYRIQKEKGIHVVLAHVERYYSRGIEELLENGIYGQMNATALTGMFFSQSRTWLKRECIVALGSDIHGTNKKYYKNFHKALTKAKKYDPDIIEKTNRILDTN